MAQTRRDSEGWDRRAWIVGLVSGNLCGMANAFSALQDKRSHTSGATARPSGDVLSDIAIPMVLFVFPAVMTLIARRRFLIWGLLPPVIAVVWAIPTRYLLSQFGQLHRDEILIPVYILLSVALVSGPISLVRHIRNQRQRRQIARLAAIKAQREAASIPQEGVWPPPPDYRK